MKDAKEQTSLLFWRKANLELTKQCFRFYAISRKKDFLDFAKFFGKQSLTFKQLHENSNNSRVN